MNLQDIADFIDLVKNPAKYEAVLKNIADEKERLNAVIETVGKASELDKLRKAVEAKAVALETEFNTKSTELEKSYQIRVKKAESLQARLETSLGKVTADSQETDKKLYEVQQLHTTLAAREKTAADIEASLKHKQADLDKLVADYTEKVAKLKAVMV